ncbi:MAG: ATP-binding protein [Gammaproteobacteria bacterium]|nr:ATP-binding protein [Gammaproteobacteria bacterium]
MSETTGEMETWFADNDRYLATGLAWLRARLTQLADAGTRGKPTTTVTPLSLRERGRGEGKALTTDNTPSFGSFFFRKDKRVLVPSPPAPLPEGEGSNTIPLPSEMIEAEATARPPALILLARRLGLSEFERHVMLLCIAMELDTRIGGLCARAQQESARPYPTFALALALFDQPAWEALSPERPLRYWRLLEINQTGAQPLIGSVLKADERIVNYVKGLNYLDDRLTSLMKPVVIEEAVLPPSQAALADGIVDGLRKLEESVRLPVFQLLGADSQSKLMVAQRAAARLGLMLYRLPADALPAATTDYETFVRLWQRESNLLPLALMIDAAHVDRAGNTQVPAIQRLFASGLGLVFLDTREPWSDVAKDSVLLDVAKPTPAEQRAAWVEVLGDTAAEHAGRLAAQFNFNLPTIRAIAADARQSGRQPVADALWQECLRRTRPTLDQLAQALETKATWDDIELAPAEKNLLYQIAQQVGTRSAVYDNWGFRQRMNRGFGISVLFAGESGTGKTMAAEIIANELGLMLYRIDLSAVVSKYIGETEKNLRKLFDAAEDGGAILFFDEADALFGKRSEVKDSHDRYANIEINYLLQRMEAYRGLAILATNMKAALDGAFLRRLRFIVNFAFPGVAERKAIWQKAFPREMPRAALDYDRLAKFNLTGGSIHNIALNAAFLAAAAGTKVTMPLLLDAMRTEFRKLEKPVNEAEFRWSESTEAAT